ncbi:MAG: flagellar basal body rod protein FlgC [Calditrichaeota bacterium]|nr:flagellar basal body rod protein FlgC [Calditrichota bacterium]
MKRLETISENIANVEKLPDADGKVYNRKTVIESFKKGNSGNRFGDEMSLSIRNTQSNHISPNKFNGARREQVRPEIEVAEVDGEKLVYDPTHPRADKNGYLLMPDISVVEEMVDMVAASRFYEANISVLNATKQMAKKAMEI